MTITRGEYLKSVLNLSTALENTALRRLDSDADVGYVQLQVLYCAYSQRIVQSLIARSMEL